MSTDVASAVHCPTAEVTDKDWPQSSELTAAADRIKPHARVTPVLTSSLLDELSGGRQLFFKCEHLQRTGSFKVRGALNALLRMPRFYEGVVTHSSGNHGQALAWAAAKFKYTCTVVVPIDTPDAKVQAMRAYGADVQFCQPNYADRRRLCESLASERHLYPVPSSDHWDVIAGQASVGLELMDQVAGLDAVLVPVSGGGLAAGLALASAAAGGPRVYCVEALGKCLTPSLAAGRPLWEAPDEFVDTLAESIRLRGVSPLALSVLHSLADRSVFSVPDAGMAEGVRLTARYLKQSVEAASGAAVFAAVRMSSQLPPSARRIGVVLSGGNLDPFSREFERLVAAYRAPPDAAE